MPRIDADPTYTPQDLSPGTVAEISYENGAGRVTRRCIEVEHRYSSADGTEYIRAYCQLRGEERTFRRDRILRIHAIREAAPIPAAAASGTAVAPEAAPAFQQHPTAFAPATPQTSTRNAEPPARKLHTGAAVCAVALLLVVLVLAIRGPAEPRVEPSPAASTQVAQANQLPQASIAVRDTEGPAGPAARQAAPDPTARLARFQEVSGIANQELIRRYLDADTNGDETLSWNELQSFQDALKKRFRYQTNSVALDPTAFLRSGGGDCEDWALMTAGLLRFWGAEVYIGSVTSSSGSHAVTLVRTERVPAGAIYFTFTESRRESMSLPAGRYVPIDYTRVGGLSYAVGTEYRIRRVRVPEDLYGRNM